MTSYSQYGEDLHIAKAVQTAPNKRLLDLGAWHATQLSNSRALIESGWAAVLVEPSPGPFVGLVKEYGNNDKITLINAPIGADRHCALMHATDDAVSTTDEGVRQRWAAQGGYYGKFWSPYLTIADLFNQFGGGYEFINIDTEGTSVEVFRTLLTLGALPRCFCVEHDDRVVEANQLAAGKGYKQIHLNGTNVIFAL